MYLKKLIEDIKGDLSVGSVFPTFLKAYFSNPSFRVLLNHRIGKYFYQHKNGISRLIASRYRYKLISKRGCDISYNAALGKKIRFPHPIGIVIGEGVVVKDNVVIFQQVTIGSHGKKGEQMKYPVISEGAKIYVGAKVIGDVRIGEKAIVGANSVVNIDVPANKIAVGIPCRILNKVI